MAEVGFQPVWLPNPGYLWQKRSGTTSQHNKAQEKPRDLPLPAAHQVASEKGIQDLSSLLSEMKKSWSENEKEKQG